MEQEIKRLTITVVVLAWALVITLLTSAILLVSSNVTPTMYSYGEKFREIKEDNMTTYVIEY